MAFKTILRELAARSGAEGAIMLAPDGEAIDSFKTSPSIELEAIGAHKGVILNMLNNAASKATQNCGKVNYLGITARNAQVAVISLKDGYFLVMILKRNGSLGKAFFEAKKTMDELEKEMG